MDRCDPHFYLNYFLHRELAVFDLCNEEGIAQVESIEPDGEMFDARIKVLSEYVKHHVKEEHNETFPKARSTNLDMKALGDQLVQRKKELLEQRK